MAAGRYDFKIEQGTTFRKTISWKDSVGNPVILTGYTARLQLRQTYTSATTLLDLTTANGGIVLDAPLGKITLLATPTQTSGIPVKKAVYDLELVAPDGTVTRLLEGKVTISVEVTR